MQSQELNSLVSAIDRYFEQMANAADMVCVDKLFICTLDYASSNKYNPNILMICEAYARAFIFNIIESVKARIKHRQPSHRRVSIIRSRTKCNIYINPHNGTAVVLGEEQVLKFYFKDVEYFRIIHTELTDITRYVMRYKEGVFVTIMPRYDVLRNGIDDKTMFLSIMTNLQHLHRRNIDNLITSKLLRPKRKVEQLIEFYNQPGNIHCAQYINLATLLEDKLRQHDVTICHGDLWIDNLLTEDDGTLVLIDYDKIITFVAAYDYVYFFLMGRVLPRKITVEQICSQIRHYADLANDYFQDMSIVELHGITSKEIRLSIFLFSLLKLVEQDLRHNKYGKSIEVLRYGFSIL